MDNPLGLACDARCDKAWGKSSRPVRWDEKREAQIYHSDDEVGVAPLDPGTWEGAHRKPVTNDERLNKWCCRECERCVWTTLDKTAELQFPDFSKGIERPW